MSWANDLRDAGRERQRLPWLQLYVKGDFSNFGVHEYHPMSIFAALRLIAVASMECHV